MRVENISVGDTLEMDGFLRVRVLRKLELAEGEAKIVVRPERPLTSFYTERCVEAHRLSPIETETRVLWSTKDKILF